jgi:hypothetical protein
MRVVRVNVDERKGEVGDQLEKVKNEGKVKWMRNEKEIETSIVLMIVI